MPWRERAVSSGALARLVGTAPAVLVEAGVSTGWRGALAAAGVTRGTVIGVDRFGASGPGVRVAAELGLTVDAVVAAARAFVA